MAEVREYESDRGYMRFFREIEKIYYQKREKYTL